MFNTQHRRKEEEGQRKKRNQMEEEARIPILCFLSHLDVSKGQLKLPNLLPVQRYPPPRLPYCDGLDLLTPWTTDCPPMLILTKYLVIAMRRATNTHFFKIESSSCSPATHQAQDNRRETWCQRSMPSLLLPTVWTVYRPTESSLIGEQPLGSQALLGSLCLMLSRFSISKQKVQPNTQAS